MRLRSLIGLGSEIGRSRTALGEVAGEDWVDEGTEDDLGAADDNVSLKAGREYFQPTRSGEEPSIGQAQT